jgi:DNA-binding NtrC family response regulator
MEEAHGGTFLLDEIGELSPSTQVTLLRVLEERSIRRLGDNRTIPVDLRIVASTNSDLEAAVRAGTFRKDLFYRLNVIRIHLPPLRDRREDIALLARHFLSRHARGHPLAGFTADALAALSAGDFPGNVRELSNVVEQAAALSAGGLIDVGDLPAPLNAPGRAGAVGPEEAPIGPAPRTLDALTRDAIIACVKVRNGNMAAIARDLGISRVTLWRRMKRYGIEIDRVVAG